MNISFMICKGVRFLADRYKSIVSDTIDYNALCAFFSLFLFDEVNYSNTVRAMPWTPSVSNLSLLVKGFKGNRFIRRMRASILKKYKGELNLEDLCYALDDTDNPKFGGAIFRKGKWRGSKGIYSGQKIVVLCLVDIKKGFAIPLNYCFAIKKELPGYKSSLDLGVDLIKEIIEEGFPKLHVVADSWFDSVELMKDLENIGIKIIVELRSNRLARSNAGVNVPWKNIINVFCEITRSEVLAKLNPKNKLDKNKTKWIAHVKLFFINKRKESLNAIAVYNRKNGITPFAYYATTDLSMPGAQLWRYARGRWKIECMFRDLKQNLSFGKLSCGGEEAADLAVCIPFIIYTSLRLDPVERWSLSERDTIGTMLKKIRLCEWNRSLELIINKPGSKLVERFKSRNDASRINKKPVNRVADKENNAYSKAA